MNPLKLLFSLGLTILLWAAAPAVSSQTCTAFYPLEDATGIEFLQTHQIESLKEAACSLRAALPLVYFGGVFITTQNKYLIFKAFYFFKIGCLLT